jgi:acyl-CoA reductase-like NAD-dependent aldehyde dehydrogenase
MKMFLAAQWHDRPDKIDVANPYDGSVIDTVPRGSAADVDAALATLVEGARIMRKLSAWERSEILRKAAAIMARREAELGRTISSEEGKILAEGNLEASRARQVIELSAEEARRIESEVVPLDGSPGAAGRLGFTLRVPCGVVAAITPFNFPLNLVAHKVAPAIAAGCPFVLKPAEKTPALSDWLASQQNGGRRT